MSKFSVAAKRFGGFMKRNAFYFLIVLCIASVATVIALAVTHNNGVNPDSGLNSGEEPVIKPDDKDPVKPNPDDEEPPVKKLTFISPCNGTVTHEFDLGLVFNASMGEWTTHDALDFTSEDLKVFASADGTIKQIGHNNLDGNYIVVEHEEGYTTKYMSLDTIEGLSEGATVKQGQLIGKMADTQGMESLKGAHLHFEMLKDGKTINPLDLLVLDEK